MSKGLDYDALFPGRFLKAGEMNGKSATLTITAIQLEALPQEKGGERIRGVFSFRGTKKQLILNQTNGQAMRAMWGRDTGDWVGKRVTLQPEWVMFGREKVLAVRVAGSPDLAGPVEFMLTLPRKKPIRVVLKKTSAGKTEPPPEGLPLDDVPGWNSEEGQGAPP